MTAAELLEVIRRDIASRIRFALGFRISNHYAANIKASAEVEADITAWIDELMKDNLSAEDSGYSDGCYNGTREDWVNRAYGAEDKLHKIKDILK